MMPRVEKMEDLLRRAAQDYPRIALEQLLHIKLSHLGYPNREIAKEMAERVFNGNSEPLKFGEEDDKTVFIDLSEDELKNIERATHNFIQHEIPRIYKESINIQSKEFLNNLKKNWPQQKYKEEIELNGFKSRIYERWESTFEKLKMLLTICHEIGKEAHDALHRSSNKRNKLTRSLVIRLHARVCQITSEVITLVENGYADGAIARWRTAHEVAVVCSIVIDGGDQLSERYIDHQFISRRSMLNDYNLLVDIGFQPISKKDRTNLEKKYTELKSKYGTSFLTDYGWAADMLNNPRPTFRDLEKHTQKNHLRSYYKMASSSVHAGSHGLFYNLGLIDGYDVILSGPTNYGLADPVQLIAAALSELTFQLYTFRRANSDRLSEMGAINLLVEEIKFEASKTQRKIEKEEKKHRQNQV